jgi:hypothetical protein
MTFYASCALAVTIPLLRDLIIVCSHVNTVLVLSPISVFLAVIVPLLFGSSVSLSQYAVFI